MHTHWELLAKLRKKEVPEGFCSEAMEFFADEGYIDDFDYAVRYIKDASRLKRQGEGRIRQYLAGPSKRIDREVVERAFAEADVDFADGLQQAIEAKARNLDLSNRKDRDKLIKHLVYRGFKLGEIFEKLRSMD